MNPETITLLRAPGTHEPLQLASVPGADTSAHDVLVGVHSGVEFRIQDGIPLLVDEAKVTGFNQRYQGIYNRIAGLYDAGIKLFGYLAGGGEAGSGGRADSGVAFSSSPPSSSSSFARVTEISGGCCCLIE